jgi:DNA-binding CsgD family transcriptional regulator
LATRSPLHKHSTSTSPPARGGTSGKAHAAGILLLAELHAQLPVGLLVNDADTLAILYASPPLPGFADHGLPLDRLVESRNDEHGPQRPAPEITSIVEEVAATGKPRHQAEFRHSCPGQEPRWWNVTLHCIDTDSWGRVVVTLAVDLTDQVRARRLLAERETRQQPLHQTIAAVRGHNLAPSLQRVADALVPALQVDVAALRLLGTDARLHLVAASGLRPAETRRLALEPITVRRLETMIERNRHPLIGALGLHWVEVRWLEARNDRIGALTIGARSKRRLPDADLELLDAAAAHLGDALGMVERSPRFLRNRSLEIALLSTKQDEAEQQPGNLRPRELGILRLYGEGLGTDQIAELLVLSPHTIRTHVRNARRRLGVSSRTEALNLLKPSDADAI